MARIVDGFVLSQFAELMKTPFYALDLTRSVAALGLDSLALVNVQHRLGAALKIDVPAQLLFGDGTLGELAAQIGALARRAWTDAPCAAASTDAAESADSADSAAAPQVPAVSDEAARAARNSPEAAAPALPAQADTDTDTGSDSTSTSTSPSAAAGWDATPGQAALWLIQQAARESHDYNEGFVAAVDGAFDPELFMLALARLAARRDALRVRFAEVDGRPVARDAHALEQSTLRCADDAAALQAARDALAAPFDLSRATWRAVLAKDRMRPTSRWRCTMRSSTCGRSTS